MNNSIENSNWQLTVENNIAWLGLDTNEVSLNVINYEVLQELEQHLLEINSVSDIKGLIIYSKKAKGFIGGADIKTFAKFTDAIEVKDFLNRGQQVFNQLDQLKIPTVAMIDGLCFGGGLELALACRYRIASDRSKLGLPEVNLGIHPGWGATVRLPKLIGGYNAFAHVILPGKPLEAFKAKSLGIVDEVIPLRQLKRTAVYFINRMPAVHRPNFFQNLSNNAWLKPKISAFLRYYLNKKINKEHYPAPYSALETWEKQSAKTNQAYLDEASSVEQLIAHHSTATNLIRVFLLRERLKSFAKEQSFKARHVHVIGAGTMGGDIAIWCALKGLTVTIQDKSYQAIAPVMKRGFSLYKKKLKHPRLIQAAMDKMIPDPKGYGITKAEVIIEAVFEDLSVKQALFKEIEQKADPHAIIATNTSSIPLDEISSILKQPERLVGIHFFNPVAYMELVEVVTSELTSSEFKGKACAFVNQISRLPLPVHSSPGFLINRILTPYLMEAVQLLQEGYAPETIDKAAESFGMMMGPIELADAVGLDVCLAVAKNLTPYLGLAVPEMLLKMIEQGKLGRKTNQGFYSYKNGKPIKQKVTQTAENKDLTHRLILRLINESYKCIKEGVVKDNDLLDAGMIFATGFAPFRGGPMHYSQQFGQDKLNEQLTQFESLYGKRYESALNS